MSDHLENSATTNLMRRSQEIYEDRWKSQLEQTHPHFFVAIEPDSEEYFLGRTLSEASAVASEVHPDRRTCVFRIGHRAALYFGRLSWTRDPEELERYLNDPDESSWSSPCR